MKPTGTCSFYSKGKSVQVKYSVLGQNTCTKFHTRNSFLVKSTYIKTMIFFIWSPPPPPPQNSKLSQKQVVEGLIPGARGEGVSLSGKVTNFHIHSNLVYQTGVITDTAWVNRDSLWKSSCLCYIFELITLNLFISHT